MTPSTQKTMVKFATALLKHQAEIWLGKDAAGIAAETLIDEDLQKRIDEWLLKEETAKQLLDAASNADNYFRQNCDDDTLRQAILLGFGDLPSVQTALTELPQAMDSNTLKQALQDAFARDLPNLTVEQHEHGAELYTDALLRAVGSIEKFVFPILVQNVLDLRREQKVANHKLDIILARLETRTLLYAFYVPPEDVFKRVRVEDFIGRKWLIEKIDQFLNDSNRKSGAFLIEGKAGLGKSAFMAYLVKTRNYFHLFGEQFRGDSNVGFAVRSLAAQLIAHFNLSTYKNIDLEKLADSPHFLQGIFNEAAGKLGAHEKIIIVCDALDEAGNSPDGRVFGLPNTLPDGVYLILSQRPVPTKMPVYDRVMQPLRAESHKNLEDVDEFLRSVARRKEVKTQLLQKHVSEERFIETLKKKSEGVWIYLYYVLDMQHGYLLPLNLENLPLGLAGYYHRYWSEWRNGTRGKGEAYWDSLYAPLLTTLAAIQQAVDVKQLSEWAGVQTTSSEVTRLLRGEWRAFMTEREEKDELGHKRSLYFRYHQSFQDFFTQTKFTELSEQEDSFARELAELTTQAHERIVVDFQHQCNGKWEELVSQPYPRQHLSAHLALAGEYETLRTLLTEGNEYILWAEAKYEANGGSYAGYLADLQFLWQHAMEEKEHSLLIRLMLIENSIRSLATNISPQLLSEVAKAKVWSLPRCFDVIRQSSNTSQQVETIKLFAPLTNSEPSQQKEVFDIAREIKDESDRARALSALAPHLNEELKAQALQEALTAAREIKAESARARALSEIAPHLNEELKELALHGDLYLQVSEEILETWKAFQFRWLDKYLVNYFRVMASKDRRNGIESISELIPALLYFFGAEIVNEVFRAIRDTARWWP